MKGQIENIKTKLEQLRQLDKDLRLFGASTHQYKINPTLSLEHIRAFETAHKVELPRGYVAFLTRLGDGGAGPFYGVQTLEESRSHYYDNSPQAEHVYFDLSQPFPHTEPWNVAEELAELYEQIEEANEQGDEELEEKLFDKKWELIGGEEHDYGRLQTTNYGCGLTISLIVNGSEKGTMWTDDRTNDGGLYPTTELGNKEKITFLDWYELWLDQSLEKLQTGDKRQEIRE